MLYSDAIISTGKPVLIVLRCRSSSVVDCNSGRLNVPRMIFWQMNGCDRQRICRFADA
jgi:hypothetical protein